MRFGGALQVSSLSSDSSTEERTSLEDDALGCLFWWESEMIASYMEGNLKRGL